MQILLENKFVRFSLLDNTHILEAFWKPETQKMVNQDFIDNIKILWHLLSTHQPIGLLADTRDFLFVIEPDLQEWYGANITENMGSHTKKVAMLVSKGLIEQMSITQTIDEDNRTGFQTQYFSEVQEALNWLKT